MAQKEESTFNNGQCSLSFVGAPQLWRVAGQLIDPSFCFGSFEAQDSGDTGDNDVTRLERSASYSPLSPFSLLNISRFEMLGHATTSASRQEQPVLKPAVSQKSHFVTSWSQCSLRTSDNSCRASLGCLDFGFNLFLVGSFLRIPKIFAIRIKIMEKG